QQGLWFIHQLDSDNPVYNVQRVLRLRGAFDLMTLSQCFQEIVCRHEVLRTRFEARDGRPVQIIENSCQVEVKLWNLIEVEESQREEMAREISRQDALRAFDLKRGPLWRIAVLRLGREDYVLLLNMHHVVCDGWSMGILVKEFITLYR